uniref:Tubulin-specific chaperone cofactor E-like protein n=1 Tax=Lygus hesperus TaxID=30085 RepID=A0A0A9X3S2_LYGHE
MPSLLEGIEAKYGRDSEDFELDIPILYVTRSNAVPPVLVFNDFGIDSAGSEESLKSKCQNVQELDLAQNSLSQWAEVMTILRIMPRLRFANLSFNEFKKGISDDLLNGGFPKLKSLILNGTHVDWDSVRKLVTQIPSLEELHLSLNGYTYVDLADINKESTVLHEGIKKLYFTDNNVSSWREISKLGQAFPNLESLILADCPVTCLDVSSPPSSLETTPRYYRCESECEGSSRNVDSPHHWFRNLKFMNLNNTLLSSWDDIDRLACFPKLEHLRLHGLPLFDEHCPEFTKHERRQLLIARLPNIRTLNGGGEICHDDREDAERAFIRRYMDKPESDRPERYNDLVGLHGKLDPLVSIDLSPEKRVKISLIHGNKSETKCLDVYQTVNELKQKLEPLVQIPVSKMKLYYVDQDLKAIHGPEDMRFPNKMIYSYNIKSGDEIIVDSKI